MVGINLSYRRMNKKELVISIMFIITVLYPLKKTELSLFSYQWQVIVAKLFMYSIVAVAEEVAFRACFIKLFIKNERLDRIISEGINKNEMLGLLGISVVFALLHFEFSWQAIYSLTYFSIACFFILICTRRISVVIILHFISNILI
jgi:membrane protease YdiL (CAAX protease family)